MSRELSLHSAKPVIPLLTQLSSRAGFKVQKHFIHLHYCQFLHLYSYCFEQTLFQISTLGALQSSENVHVETAPGER